MSADDGTTRGSGAGAAAPLPSDPAAIEALIAQRRAALATTIDELVVRAHPRQIARRSAAGVRDRLRGFAYSDDGQLRAERLGAVAAAGIALVGLLLTVRRLNR
jgi:Protein of unknown function (DUF3618)